MLTKETLFPPKSLSEMTDFDLAEYQDALTKFVAAHSDEYEEAIGVMQYMRDAQSLISRCEGEQLSRKEKNRAK